MIAAVDQVRRAEQLKAECKLLRAVYRAAKAFMDTPDSTTRALEATIAVYDACYPESAGPGRGDRKLPVAGRRGAR